MKWVYIVGGDGFARECYNFLSELMKEDSNLLFGGFLGHNNYGDSVDYKKVQHLYKGDVSKHVFKENEYAIIGAGASGLRKIIYEDLKKQGVNFYTLISKSSKINEFVDYDEANIFINSSPSPDVKIGKCNLFNGEVIIGHDCVIGDFNFFAPRVLVLGGVKIGNENSFGANSIMLPHSKIGNNNVISPLSCIYKGCKNNSMMHGNPAVKVGATCE